MTAAGPVLIAGGGIGGLALSLALARHDIPSLVLERRQEFSEAGAGIQISPNGAKVLAAIGALHHLSPSAGRPDAIVVRRAATARIVQRLPLGTWIEARHGAPYFVAHRRDLQAALLAAATDSSHISIHTGAGVTGHAGGGAGVTVACADGRRFEGRALIGADGIFSRIRAHLSPEAAPHHTGRAASRTVVAAEAFGTEFAAATTVGVWVTAGAHVVHYPVRGGREIAVIVIAPEAGEAQGWSKPVDGGDMAALIGRTAPILAPMLADARDWRRWSLYDAAPADTLAEGSVALIGDAAHPVLPFLAQGANLALEDAWTLAECLARIPGQAVAFASYAQLRRRRIGEVAAASRRNGKIFHMNGGAALARDLALALLPPGRTMARYDWIYGWRPELSDRELNLPET